MDDELIEVDIELEPETIELLEAERHRLESRLGRPFCLDEVLNHLLEIARRNRP